MAYRTPTQSDETGRRTWQRHERAGSPFSDMPSPPPATHPNTALPILHLSYPIARWDVPVLYRCIFVLCQCATPSPTPLHTLAGHPGPPTPTQKKDTRTSAHPGSHSLHRFRIPPSPKQAQRARADKVWGAIPPHSHLPEVSPVLGFYLRSDPSLSWPAGRDLYCGTLSSPERQARPCARCTALS